MLQLFDKARLDRLWILGEYLVRNNAGQIFLRPTTRVTTLGARGSKMKSIGFKSDTTVYCPPNEKESFRTRGTLKAPSLPQPVAT